MTPQILLVDDNAVQAATRDAILSKSGLRVVVANHAEEALEVLSRPEIRASIRLVITDHFMPDVNGPELVQRLRVLLPTLSVLVLSGMPGIEEEYEGLNVTFCLKPFPPEELIRITHQLVGQTILRSA